MTKQVTLWEGLERQVRMAGYPSWKYSFLVRANTFIACSCALQADRQRGRQNSLHLIPSQPHGHTDF